MKKWDVIIVGAGPAGIAAAMAIVRNGGQPLLIDRKTFPRYKPCAGMLSNKAACTAPFELAPAICAVSERTVSIERATRSITYEKNLLSHRIELDSYLFNQAITHGVPFRHITGLSKLVSYNDGVRLMTTQHELLSAHHLIAADGANSEVRRLLNLHHPSPPAFAIEIDIDLQADNRRSTAIFDFDAAANGYAWIFPKGSTANVGIATMNRSPKSIDKLLRSYIEKTGLSLERSSPLRGGPIGSFGASTCLGTGRVLFCGDAARLADPWTGEGISYAFLSGEAAGRAVIAGLGAATQPLKLYRQELHSEIDFLAGRTRKYQ